MAATPELAAFIVRAANAALLVGATVPIRLSEPAPAQPIQRDLDIVDDDPCCNPKLVRALARGVTADVWACPKCDTTWKADAETVPGVRRWSPHAHIEVIHSRRL